MELLQSSVNDVNIFCFIDICCMSIYILFVILLQLIVLYNQLNIHFPIIIYFSHL